MAQISNMRKPRIITSAAILALVSIQGCVGLTERPELYLDKWAPQQADREWVAQPATMREYASIKGHCRTASENEDRHRDGFSSILLRIVGPRTKAVESPLPKDLRSFDDYNAYVTSAVSLWVWSDVGLENQKPLADPNRGQLIYEHQAVMELMESSA